MKFKYFIKKFSKNVFESYSVFAKNVDLLNHYHKKAPFIAYMLNNDDKNFRIERKIKRRSFFTKRERTVLVKHREGGQKIFAKHDLYHSDRVDLLLQDIY